MFYSWWFSWRSSTSILIASTLAVKIATSIDNPPQCVAMGEEEGYKAHMVLHLWAICINGDAILSRLMCWTGRANFLRWYGIYLSIRNGHIWITGNLQGVTLELKLFHIWRFAVEYLLSSNEILSLTGFSCISMK